MDVTSWGTLGQPYLVCAVFHAENTQDPIFDGEVSTKRARLRVADDGTFSAYFGATASSSAASTATMGATNAICMTANGASSTIDFNDSETLTFASTIGGQSLSEMYIGCDRNSGRLDGSIFEVITFADESASDSVMDYFVEKYGSFPQ